MLCHKICKTNNFSNHSNDPCCSSPSVNKFSVLFVPRKVIFLIVAQANVVQLLNLNLAIKKKFGFVDNFFGPAHGTGPGG